ncbi:histidine kinase [Mariprofundus ferrooxydans]|uniref:histidine kinase n=2 Tax=Mariprofundus ferrooxydans TaxID=314344 RepID=Q0EYB5_9PROT|nr:response regulator [Mariprofundus ferrooxydans]EAU54277.1 sensor histidine kinase/response regulator [Mariprofundus ferrooxydans PV-1]KON47819.1 histidine kinase [Mariprofundus ferrooxydans]
MDQQWGPMHQLHHTLKRDLTNTLLIWSTAFFALLVVGFLFSFHQIEHYMLGLVADHRLSYQTREFAKHLDQQDNRTIQQEGDTLAQGDIISAILMVDASGELLHLSMNKNSIPALVLTQPVNMESLQKQVKNHGHLHLFKRKIPGHHATLALIMDDRPIEIALFSATTWTALLLLALVLISIKALHISLRRSLVIPVEKLRHAINDGQMDQQAIMALEQTLPDEASEILDIFDHLKHAHTDMRAQITTMVATMPSCFWCSNDGKTYTGASDRTVDILRVPSSELMGHPLWAWTGNQEQIAVNHRLLQQGIAKKRTRLDFAYQVTSDGDTRWFGENITICYDKQDQPSVIYGIINDISKRKNSQQQQAEALEEQHRLQATSTLVGGIAHEFNNALAGMNGNLFLIRQAVTDEQALVRINRIEQLINRSATMIERMLAFSRQCSTHPSSIDLIEFLESFRISVLPALPETLRFELHLDAIRKRQRSERPLILADMQKLQEVLFQLIDNARLATRHAIAPRIDVALEYMVANDDFLRHHAGLSSRELLHLTIEDNGNGIPDEIKRRVFEPFFTTREIGEGTGLGLSMAHGYIHQIGGDIDFDSHTGIGTTFHIYLPAIINHSDVSPSDSTILRGHNETILVVDDDKMVRESTCSILERMGYQPVPAKNGEQAVEIFTRRQAEIRLVFMDILMPGINGIEATRRIRKLSPDMPVIFLTGYDRTQPLEPEVYAENTELINKPFRISMLSDSIQQALAGNLGKSQE